MFLRYIFFILYSPYIYYLNKTKKSFSEIYNFLKSKPFGREVFSVMISSFSPYSGSIDPLVEEFDKNKAQCSIVCKRYLKNPFNSVHALALANLGELTSGLLMMDYLKSSKKKRYNYQIN